MKSHIKKMYDEDIKCIKKLNKDYSLISQQYLILKESGDMTFLKSIERKDVYLTNLINYARNITLNINNYPSIYDSFKNTQEMANYLLTG